MTNERTNRPPHVTHASPLPDTSGLVDAHRKHMGSSSSASVKGLARDNTHARSTFCAYCFGTRSDWSLSYA